MVSKVNENTTQWGNRYPNSVTLLRQIEKESETAVKNHLDSIVKRKFNFDSLEQKNEKLNLIIGNKIIDTSTYNKVFNELSLNQQLKDNLEMLSFTQMTPIQRLTIPHVIKQCNLVGCAQTGSGKTLAYLLPIANLLLSSSPTIIDKDRQTSLPVVLIIVPTRELAEQTYKEALKVFHMTKIIPAVIYGGCAFPPQIDKLRAGVDIIIATPGRLIDLLNSRLIKFYKIQYVIIDEADCLLDMGFEPDINQIMEGYDMPSVEKRTTLMFSATFPNKVLKVIKRYLKNYILVTIGYSLEESEDPNANVEQRLYYLNDNSINAKLTALHQLLEVIQGKTIIFVNMKRTAESLTNFMNSNDYSTIAIHGDKSQSEREYALKSFSKGSIPILIATDVASRGLDIPNVDFIINFDFPSKIDDYIHRIGRTGRCGIKGRAISFVNSYDSVMFPSVHKLLVKSHQKIPDFLTQYGS